MTIHRLPMPATEFAIGDAVRLDDGRDGIVMRRAFGLGSGAGQRLIGYDVKVLGGPLVVKAPHQVHAPFAGAAA